MPSNFENYTEDDYQALAEQMNRPRSGLNIERFADDLLRAANAADVISEAYRIIDEAQKRNPRGLVF